MARVVQDRVCAHATSGRCATAAGLWPRTMMMGTVLAILVCLTTWALASVAPWMTPVYLALMVLIFVTPRNQHQLSVLSKRSPNPLANEERDRKQEPSMEGTGEVAIVRLTDQLVGGSTANQSTLDPTGSIPDSVGGNAVKQWRGRIRTRKTSRPAAEAASDTPAVAWIRVGPGKFVRADSKTPAIAQVQALGSGTEEHGIAPSALGPPHTSAAPPDCAGDKVSSALVDATFEPNPVAGLTEKALDCDSGFERPRLQHAWSRAKSNRVLRGFAGAILAADRARARCSVGTGSNPRTSLWSPIRPNRLPQPSARRASRRVSPRQRALGPRSPPYSSLENEHGVAVAEKPVMATYGLGISSLD